MKKTRRIRKACNESRLVGYTEGYIEGYKQGLHDGNPFTLFVENLSKVADSVHKLLSDPAVVETLERLKEQEKEGLIIDED